VKIRRIGALKTAQVFREYLTSIGADLAFDEEMESGPESPLAQSMEYKDGTIGNRFSILPMEGWDADPDGRPNDLVRRRWQHFGESGAKLIWGGEAVAVRHDGRANPNQLVFKPEYVGDFTALREHLVQSHAAHFGNSDDLLIGLQLTHSGRFYRLIEDFIAAAKRTQEAGFDFVDVKHCHGYLGHEFLTAIDRPGKYGGSFENRTRFLREIAAGIRAEAPGLDIGVRLSAFDMIPFVPNEEDDRRGVPVPSESYPYAFGGDSSGLQLDLEEPLAFLALLKELDIQLVCLTAGSPYYTPHIQRPAFFPPSDGYKPPEDPLLGAARQIQAAAILKRQCPELIYVGTGYSYLQDWLPNVAQNAVRNDLIDFVGIGRMVLSYHELPADVLAGRAMQRKRICRTFSDCTTAPRNGLISGCYPLDDFYKERPEFEELQRFKGAG